MISKIYDGLKKFIKENYKFLIVWTFILLLFWIDLPYVVYRPGGTINLGKRIDISDGFDYDGSINMTYVSMMKGNIPFILMSYVIPNWDIEKKENVTYEGDSIDETLKKDKLSMDESVFNAIYASYKLTGNEITIKDNHCYVTYISSDSKTDLKDFDEILEIEGVKVNNLKEMQNVVTKYQKDDSLEILVKRDKKEKIVKAKVFEIEGISKIGVAITPTYDFESNPKIDIKIKNSESGPSGGLMLSLGIYNSLTKDDITKGLKVAGTGTIDIDGLVGEIGGIKYKILGAIKDDVDIFLCPKENYDEAIKTLKKTKSKMKIIQVSSLEDAINKLSNVK